eukprot:COSAG05_NODE_121_length_17719_cov_168.686266_11_plen_63_part_00
MPPYNFNEFMSRDDFEQIESVELWGDPDYPQGPADPNLVSDKAGQLFDPSNCGNDPFAAEIE